MAERRAVIRTDFTGRFCRVVEAGGFVFLSGVLARGGGDVAGQTSDVLQQIDDLLAKVGLMRSDLVCANIWLADISHIGAMNEVWDQWVDPASAPVRATVESKLARPDALIEIQVQAFRT